jgi:MFS transporter, ACS family, solute carrier family 17 (sodium-dependent inorganic phosphate cotransporter), member 5
VKLDFSLQIPFGILAKKYGSLGFLGWGMLINSIFGFLVPISAQVSESA